MKVLYLLSSINYFLIKLMVDNNRGKNLSRAQEKAKSYIDEHGIEKIISEMLNSLVHARDP